MNVRFAKWGNSLAVRIPASFAQEIELSEGSVANISIENGCLVVRPLADPEFHLSDLVSQISESNIHGEIKTGFAVGNEFY